MGDSLRTTRPVAEVRTIEDIVAIESRPYDELVTARNLYDLLLATAKRGGELPALTVLAIRRGRRCGSVSFTHSGLLARGDTRGEHVPSSRPGGGPRCRGISGAHASPSFWPLLLGAQVAGVASSLNYLLSEEAIFDLLNAQQATILVIPSVTLDETCWRKAASAFDRVPTLEHVIVIGGGAEGAPGFMSLDEAIAGAQGEKLEFRPLRIAAPSVRCSTPAAPPAGRRSCG